MGAFILIGSKGGAGRTASSVVLATGLSALGTPPLHLQVTMSGCPPVLALAKNVPFATEWLPDEQATPDAIRRCVEKHPECATVVIDMPKRRVKDIAFPDLDAAMLLPMRRARHEIEVAVRNYRELQSLVSATNGRDRKPPPSQHAVRLLPVGWPLGTCADDFVSILGHFEDATETNPPSVLMPGIPNLPSDDLDDLINGASFLCSPMISDAASMIARAVLKETGKSSA